MEDRRNRFGSCTPCSRKENAGTRPSSFWDRCTETSLALVITKLIRPGHLDWSTALEKMTINPAQILGIAKGTLQIGADADVTIIDPEAAWTVDSKDFYSKSSNSPFLGETLTGRQIP